MIKNKKIIAILFAGIFLGVIFGNIVSSKRITVSFTPDELNDLSDVNTTGAAVDKILKYNGTTWIVGNDETGGGGGGDSYWDRALTTLYTHTNNDNVQINGTLQAAAGTFTTLDTGYGAKELGQNVRTTDAVTFTTVNTGQGANELYDMDQNVQTSDYVNFESMSITGYGLHEYPIDNPAGLHLFYDFADDGMSWILSSDPLYETLFADPHPIMSYGSNYYWCNGMNDVYPDNIVMSLIDAGYPDTMFLGLGVDNNLPTYCIQLPTTEDEQGTGIAYDWATYSDNRVKSWIMELPKNKVIDFCENVDIKMYNPINSSVNKTTGLLEFGDIDTTKVNVGISAQDLYSYVSSNFNEMYANSVVHKPSDETTGLWGVSYRNVQMIFDRMTQINNDRITNMENFLIQYGYDPDTIY